MQAADPGNSEALMEEVLTDTADTIFSGIQRIGETIETIAYD
jgi:hypothetical protein